MRCGRGIKLGPTHCLKTSTLLHRPALQVRGLPERSSLLQGNECLVSVRIVGAIWPVEDVVKINVLRRAGSSVGRIIIAGVQRPEDVDLGL
jgi:hypothetical protein